MIHGFFWNDFQINGCSGPAQLPLPQTLQCLWKTGFHTLNASRLDLRYHLEIASAWAFCKVSPRIYYKGKYTLASSFELYSTWGSLIWHNGSVGIERSTKFFWRNSFCPSPVPIHWRRRKQSKKVLHRRHKGGKDAVGAGWGVRGYRKGVRGREEDQHNRFCLWWL